jgi:hypothetical protein
MNSSPVDSSEISSPVNMDMSGIPALSVQEEVYLRAQQEFENQLVQCFQELTNNNGIDASTAEYDILCRLCVSTGTIVVDETELKRFMIDGRLRRDEAVRALVIQRELDSLSQKGFTLLDSITELILRLNNKNSSATTTVTGGSTSAAVMKKGVQVQQQQHSKKKKMRELSNLCVMSKNKVRVHRRQEDDAIVVGGKEAFVLDGESPRPAKKLRKDGGGSGVVVDREVSDRKRLRSKANFKTSGKFN